MGIKQQEGYMGERKREGIWIVIQTAKIYSTFCQRNLEGYGGVVNPHTCGRSKTAKTPRGELSAAIRSYPTLRSHAGDNDGECDRLLKRYYLE